MKVKFRELELILEGQYDATIPKHVQYPVYINDYEDALRTILLDTLRMKAEEAVCKERGFHRFSGEKENLIAFLGGRGTGKTTAVEEFCRILESMSDRSEYQWWLNHAFQEKEIYEELKYENYYFHVFSRIDVSMLENKEDLFEMIMSNLFSFFKAKENCSCGLAKYTKENEEIIRLFDEILKGYYAIRDSREDEYVDSYIVKVQYVFNSLDLQQHIEELLARLFSKEEKCGMRCYLVVVLDDLDLNIEHGFEMLKQVRKYFCNTRMLIIFSADYDQLNEVCWVHFMKAFSGETSHVIEDAIKEKCRELSKDYIGKALPISKRIHMPELFSEAGKVMVLREQESGIKNITIKHYTMERIASNLRICYDIKGIKKHFSEPGNIRELVNYHRFLEELQEINFEKWNNVEPHSSESKIYMKRYDQNHGRMNGDIENRLANRLLSKKQKYNFDRWINISLERRAESAWAFMWDSQLSLDHDIDDEMDRFLGINSNSVEEPMQNDMNQNYCFGSLLKEIYTYGRNNSMNKAYVKCILASLSSEMVREKVSFDRNPDENQRNESKKNLQRLFGNSFGDEWLGEMMPKRIDPDQLELRNTGYRQAVNEKIRTINICPIPEKILEEAYNKNRTAIRKTVKKLLDLIGKSQLVSSLEWILMFASLCQEKGKIPITFKVVTTENTLSNSYQERYVLQAQIDNETWSIWEFIPKTLDFHGYLKKLHENLSVALCELFADRLGFQAVELKKENQKIIFEWIKGKSLFQGEADESLNHSVFPFYQVDMAYNVLKRARRELLAENPEFCDRMELFSYMKSAYKKVEEKLKEEESEYEKLGIELKYAERFSTFPFVKMMVDGTYKNKVSQGILDCLQTILWGTEKAENMYTED